MNFLAHLHLAEPTPDSRLGNLLGDFVKGNPWDDRFSIPVWKGVMEHRYVDAFTDNHPVWQKSRALLPADLRRFAGIIIDIFYDYFLSKHWEHFSGVSLEKAVDSIHRDLESVLYKAPEEAREVIAGMISEKWLLNYQTIPGIDETINRVSRRSDVLIPVWGACEMVIPHIEEMEAHFFEFYPALLSYLKEVRAVKF
ncbi:MAG: ACP phosphodiesterase [Verrucomicrobiales bacterium]|nr:ACP phosphodiesterase [Verrucomicrobiales bacterium]